MLSPLTGGVSDFLVEPIGTADNLACQLIGGVAAGRHEQLMERLCSLLAQQNATFAAAGFADHDYFFFRRSLPPFLGGMYISPPVWGDVPQ